MAVRTSLLLISVLAAGACFGQDNGAAKPKCNAENAHKLWPEKPERGSGVPVEICMSKNFRYKWQALTVDISELRAKAEAENQGARDEKASKPPAADERR